MSWKEKTRNLLSRACEFAIPVVGATLIAYGAWMIYAPAGFIAGGLLVFVIEHVWGVGERGTG